MRKVLVPGSIESWTPAETIDYLKEHRCEVAFRSSPAPYTEDSMIEAATGLHGVIAGGFPFTRRVLDALPELLVVSRIGVGYDTVDLDAATDCGVYVTNTPGANSESVADWAMTLLLSVSRRIVELDRRMRAGEWDRTMTPEIFGKTLGIIGLGHIGKCLARRARAFDMTVLAYELYPDAEFAKTHDVAYVPLDELFTRSDVVSIHCPLSAQTHGLVGARELRLMKPTAIVVNTARGQIIDEPSLITALQEGGIAGAGLDVFTEEPLLASPLREMDNVVLAPHIASGTHEARARSVNDAARNVVETFDGKRPFGLVNKDCALKTVPVP